MKLGKRGRYLQIPSKGFVIRFLLSLFLIAFYSCKNDRSFQVKKGVGDLEFIVDYHPYSFQGEVPHANNLEYFKLELNHSQGLDIVDHLSEVSGLKNEDILYYLSFKLKEDIYLLNGDKKCENVLFHFERSFDLKKGRVFNIGFQPEEGKGSDISLLIDSKLLNVGPVKLTFGG